MRDDWERILDMREASANIERHTEKGREVFESDEPIQTWVVHHLEITGEAASKLGPGFRAAHSEVPWSEIVAMRNEIVHEYFGIDLDEIWPVVERDLPELKQKLNGIVEGLTQRGKDD